MQILTVFPNMVLQQVRNTIAVRVIRPRGVDKTELDWVHLGFDDDDEAMTERRLRQGNLIGAAGYISMEDGCVGGFVQRALQYNDDDSGVVMMGGHDAQSQNFRASEAAIRGFWKKYRALTGADLSCARQGRLPSWTRRSPSCGSAIRSAMADSPPMPIASTTTGSRNGRISSSTIAAT